MNIIIEIGDQKAAAMDILEAQSDEELRIIFEGLPECTPSDFAAIVATLPPGTLPSCRPEGQTYDYFKNALSIDVCASVDALVGSRIPDSWVFTEEGLRDSLGPENSGFIDEAREWASSGWTFSDVDLRSRLERDDQETLDDVRNWIADGYSADETDLREWLADDAEMELEEFDRGRQLIHDIRAWLWAFWLIPILLLVGIGLLGGRNWRTKLGGPLVILLVTCLGIYIALAVIQAQVINSRADNFLDDPLQFEGMERAVLELGNDLSYSTVSSFIAGTERIALYLMIGSGVIIMALVITAILRPKKEPPIEAPDTAPDKPDQIRPGTPS